MPLNNRRDDLTDDNNGCGEVLEVVEVVEMMEVVEVVGWWWVGGGLVCGGWGGRLKLGWVDGC